MTNTNSITFDLAWYTILSGYSATIRRKVCDAVLNFAATGEIPSFKGIAKIAFELIAHEISKQIQPNSIPSESSEYSESSETSEKSEISESSEYSDFSENYEKSEISEPLKEIAEIREILEEKTIQSPPDIVKAIFNPEGITPPKLLNYKNVMDSGAKEKINRCVGRGKRVSGDRCGSKGIYASRSSCGATV